MEKTRSSQLRWKTAYERIKADILEGRYLPGEAIRVTDVTAEQKMSRYPVMDALKHLAAEQLVEIVPQVGCRVATVDLRAVSDHFRFVASAEGLLAELAAERAEDADLRELERIAHGIETLKEKDLADKRQAQHYRLLNRQFHGMVHEMAAAPMLASTIVKFWDRNDFFVSATPGLLFLERLEDAVTEHRAILNALVRRDATAARKAAEGHVLQINKQIADILRRRAGSKARG